MKRHQFICTVIVTELVWNFYIRFVRATRDIRDCREFDIIKTGDERQFKNFMETICEFIKRDPERYWKRIVYPLKLDEITACTVKDVIRSLSRDVRNIFITRTLVNELYSDVCDASNNVFKEGSKQRHHIESWYTNNITITPIMLWQTLILDGFDVSTDLLFFITGWRPIVLPNNNIAMWKLERCNACDEPPIVVFPGLCGHRFYKYGLLTDLQNKFPDRTIYIFEVPFTELKDTISYVSWDTLISNIIRYFAHESLDVFDLYAHSYGTHVANRLIRYIRGLYPYESHIDVHACHIRKMFLIEPPIFNATSSGYSTSFMTNKMKIKNFTILSNSQGVPWIETIDYHIDDIEVYVYVSVNDSFIPCETIEPECERWIKNYTIAHGKGKHGQCLLPIKMNPAYETFKSFIQKY